MVAVEQEWRTLTWAALEDWAGLRCVERGRLYCRAGRVLRVALTEEGDVAAWVRGGGRYRCRVRLDGGLRGTCDCPFDGPGCKHAVAAVLAYLDALRRGREVPDAESDDLLWPLPEFDGSPAVAPLPDDEETLREQIAAALVFPLPSSCEAVLPHLRRLSSLLARQGRAREWQAYEAELCAAHPRQWRLREVLGRLRERRILPA